MLTFVAAASQIVSFNDWSKINLQIAEILSVESVEGSDKLYKLRIRLGTVERTLVAGIAQHYTKEELVGKLIVVLTNLEPKIIRGIKSEGMLLAALDERGGLALLTTDKKVPSGTKVE